MGNFKFEGRASKTRQLDSDARFGVMSLMSFLLQQLQQKLWMYFQQEPDDLLRVSSKRVAMEGGPTLSTITAHLRANRSSHQSSGTRRTAV